MGKRFEIDTDVRTDDEIRADLLDTAKVAIGFDRVYPPNHPVTSLTFFGGQPVGPAWFRWPRRKMLRWQGGDVVGEETLPATFLGQIDLGALPRFDGRQLLAAKGVLYLFFTGNNLQEDGGGDPLVQHIAGPTDAWRPIPLPADAPPCYGAEACYEYGWVEQTDRAEERYPRSFLKWEMRPAPVASYVDEAPEGYGDGVWARYVEMREAAQIEAALTLHPVPAPFVNASAPRGEGLMAAPFDGFPHCWLAIEMFAGLALKVIGDGRRFDSKGQGGNPDPESAAEASAWVSRARLKGPIAAVGPDDAAEFWCWIDSMCAAGTGALYDCRSRRNIGDGLAKAATLSAEVCLANDTASAALVPPAMVEALRSRHSATRLANGGKPWESFRHQLLGHPGSSYNAIRQYGGSNLLLFSLASDDGLGWMFGDVHQLLYWIPREDLAALRFDRIQMTLSEG